MNDERKPAHFKCTQGDGKRFTAGTAYEVWQYEGESPVLIDEENNQTKLPDEIAKFEPYDPWAWYRKYQ